MIEARRRGRVALLAAIALLATLGCKTHYPIGLVPSTIPIDDASRINVVGKETMSESCQWTLIIAYMGNRFFLPISSLGNQYYLAVDRALGDEYDGLVSGSVDQELGSIGISFAKSSSTSA